MIAAMVVIMMAFFLTIPINMTMPTIEYMFKSVLKMSSVTRAPNPAEGRPERMVRGWMKLS
jgi:hypothetical protein